ncbi:MAG: hypothetical protein C0485_08740 [Pirellula sp.]|nr:hypothetical protein [Pirellula sp.]
MLTPGGLEHGAIFSPWLRQGVGCRTGWRRPAWCYPPAEPGAALGKSQCYERMGAMSSRSVDMLEAVFGPARGSYATPLRGQEHGARRDFQPLAPPGGRLPYRVALSSVMLPPGGAGGCIREVAECHWRVASEKHAKICLPLRTQVV